MASEITVENIQGLLENAQLTQSDFCWSQFVSDVEIKTASNKPLSLSLRLPFFLGDFEEEFSAGLKEVLQEGFPDEKEAIKDWQILFKQKVEPYSAKNAVKPYKGIKNIIAIASGKGGVGKSSTAVNLALALQAMGANVGLLDADIYGPNLALMLGVPESTRPEVEAQKYFLPLKAQGIQSMSMSYVTTEATPIVWRGPKASGAFSQLLTTTLWHELDYLLIDMPPGTGDVQLTLGQSVPVNGAVIVTTPQNMATQDAQKGIEMFSKVNVPVLGVVENMSTYICPNCGHEAHVFGQGGGELLSQKYEAPFLGALPLNAAIREDCDSGFPTVAKAPESDIAQAYFRIAMKLQLNLAAKGQVVHNQNIQLVGD
jgi:ATP-binding protein involved in chromosome partitioning